MTHLLKLAGTCAFLIVLPACGGKPAPDARTPDETAEQLQARAKDQKQLDAQRDFIRAQDDNRRNGEAKRLGTVDAGPQPVSDAPTTPEMRAQQAAAHADELRKLCGPSQATRATEAQTYAKTWSGWFARIGPKRGAIKTSCVVRDAMVVRGDGASSDGATIVRLGNGGTMVEYSCKNLPKGVTKDDALRVLRFDSDWAHTNDPGYLAREMVVPEEASGTPVNRQCGTYDADSDLDTQVTLGNTAGTDKLLKWKPKSPPSTL